MTDLIHVLQTLGELMMEHLWFPALIWTAIAIPAALLLHFGKSIPAVYQYHGRAALLISLPAGILASYVSDFFTTGTMAAPRLFTIENPIALTVSGSTPATESTLWSPAAGLGLIGLLLICGAMFYLLKTAVSFLQIKKMEQNLTFHPLMEYPELVERLPSASRQIQQVQIAFSPDTGIPFTYGWLKARIVIPADFQNSPESLAMALQHELMHMKHRDYLLNGILLAIKSIFWIHPLAHYLHNTTHEYREITCDTEVLANKQFSRKQYAALLFRLAEREYSSSLAMSMAVNSSNLKKRIQTMTSQTRLPSKFRSSVIVTVLGALLVVITISCTDMTDNGITNNELQQAQTQLKESPKTQTNPLYVVNGEQWDQTDDTQRNKIMRLKPKYIQSINVLKNGKATDKYGQAGQNGAVEITVNNPDKAFSDLKTDEEMAKSNSTTKEDYYVQVETMPQLKGGLAALQTDIIYPEKARKAKIEGRVIIQFVVNKQGKVENPQVIKGIGGGCDEEALRVVKNAEFEPGRQDGQPVPVQFSLPITYQLPKETKG